MSYPHMLKDLSSKDDVTTERLEELLLEVLGTIPHIYPVEMEGVSSEMIESASQVIRSCFAVLQENLFMQRSLPEISLLAGRLAVLDNEAYLYSEKLNVSGVPYRLLDMDGSYVPVIIKTGSSPEKGVWMNDRLHISSFAMLAEEMHGSPVKYGFVLYARSGVFRKVNIHSNDRRQVLSAINRVRKIKEGKMPDKKENPLCEGCSYWDMCNVRSSLVSKFF